jgi:2-polyprenyl-6-methoxyphenol hydroxylase-like FAD-dependent oxidoreductase
VTEAAVIQTPFKVIVVGAGTGGLCLAQGLKARDVPVEVFERDERPTDRLQGYRLGLNRQGNQALRACLPPGRFDALMAASAEPSRALTFLDHRLKRLLSIDLSRPGPADPADRERPISRIALREELLKGLDDVVRFGRKFVAYEAREAGVAAVFDDQSTAAGAVLVGADGAGSRVRAQLLPQARRVDTGIVIISGKVTLTPAVRAAVPAALLLGPTLILGPPGTFMFANAVEYPDRPAGAPPADEGEEYVMWGLSARRDQLGLAGEPDGLDAQTLRAAALATMRGWSDELIALVRSTDRPDAFAARTSVRVPPWPTQRVTLLGDALHNMTPYRGVGANTALRDAGALCEALTAVAQNKQPLIPSLAAYEAAMIDYGFAAVEASLDNMRRFHAQSRTSRALTKAVLRLADHVAPLQAMFRS